MVKMSYSISIHGEAHNFRNLTQKHLLCYIVFYAPHHLFESNDELTSKNAIYCFCTNWPVQLDYFGQASGANQDFHLLIINTKQTILIKEETIEREGNTAPAPTQKI
jgi:hypothetical protein